MNLRILFIISAILQLSTWVFTLSLDYDTHHNAFYVVEVLTIANIIYLIFFYRKVNRPIMTLSDGLDLLKGQDWNSTLKKVGQPEVDKIASTFNDMILRLKEQRLRFEEQSHFLNMLIERAPIGIIILEFDGSIAIANPAAGRMFNMKFSDMPGKKTHHLGDPLGSCLASLGDSETRLLRTNHGETYKCSRLSLVDKGIVHPFYLIEDIGDAMADAERSAYEKIIRIIAHEVNNTVAPIASALGVVSDIMSTADDDGQSSALLESCADRALGMSDFVSRLADVVKMPEPTIQSIDINDMLRHSRPFLESLCMPSGCSLTLDLSDDVPECHADVALLEQCIVNLVKNASESIASTRQIGRAHV